MSTWEANSGQKEQQMPNTEACLRSRKDVVIRALCVLDGVRRWTKRRWGEILRDLHIPGRHLGFIPTVEAVGSKQGIPDLLSCINDGFGCAVRNGLSWS